MAWGPIEQWVDRGWSPLRVGYWVLSASVFLVTLYGYVSHPHHPGAVWYLVGALAIFAFWALTEMLRWRIRHDRLEARVAASAGRQAPSSPRGSISAGGHIHAGEDIRVEGNVTAGGSIETGSPTPAVMESSPDLVRSVFDTETHALPEYPTVAYTSSKAEMHQLAPNSWLVPFGPKQPEMILRVGAASPAIPASNATTGTATRIRGEARERWLIDTLEASSFTRWLRGLAPVWHWEDEVHWEVHGSGQVDFTELVFRPAWPTPNQQSLVARFGVGTGWRPQPNGEFVPALRVACDLMLNLLELDQDRRPDTIRHATTPLPTPGALSLDELADYLLELMAVPTLAKEIGQHLLPNGDLTIGFVGAWMTLSGVEFQRLVEVSDLTRVSGAVSVNDHVRLDPWPLTCGSTADSASRSFVADFMDELLERGGYRGVLGRFTKLRNPYND